MTRRRGEKARPFPASPRHRVTTSPRLRVTTSPRPRVYLSRITINFPLPENASASIR